MGESQQNYTTEQTALLLELYSKLGTDGLEEIAQQIGKPVRSVRSKLVKEGVYVASEKKPVRKTGTSKKELLRVLEDKIGFDTTGFTGSTKQALADLIVYLDSKSNPNQTE